jgi:putative phosphoribosyl transferase
MSGSIFLRLLKEDAKGVALRTPKKQKPKELILAIPVGPPDTVKQLGKEADRVIRLSTPRLFWAVGTFYGVFDQTPDEEVKRLLGAL